MTQDLAALGLVPDAAEHPDAELFTAINRQIERDREWRACRSEKQRGAVLRKWQTGRTFIEDDTFIARTEPTTVLGLLTKANFALKNWRNDDNPSRYARMWAVMATSLELAIATIEQANAIELASKGRGAPGVGEPGGREIT